LAPRADQVRPRPSSAVEFLKPFVLRYRLAAASARRQSLPVYWLSAAITRPSLSPDEAAGLRQTIIFGSVWIAMLALAVSPRSASSPPAVVRLAYFFTTSRRRIDEFLFRPATPSR
jgi:hypothetical protein